MAKARAATRKTPTNLSLRADLVRRAKAAGLNLSEVMERALEAEVEQHEHGRWLAENADAIARYNEFVEQHGAFGDKKRLF